jgi:sec-independent protein translocase protein TatB
MGNLGWTEMFFIGVIALMVFGPKRLPEMGRKLGRIMGQLRQASDQFKQVWDHEVEKANLKDLQKQVQIDLSPNSFTSNTTSTTSNTSTNNLAPENNTNTPSLLESNINKQTEPAISTDINPISGLADSNSIPSNINNDLSPISPVTKAEEIVLSPPTGSIIERAKPSFDLPPTSKPEAIVQAEEIQPISLTKN